MMLANGQETFFWEMNKHACSYTMYFPMVFDSTFDFSVYKSSVEYLLAQVPHLKRRCKEHFWRPSWVELEGFQVNQLFEVKELDARECETVKSFYTKAMSCFYEMKDKTIDLDKEPPLKFKAILDKNRKWYLIVLGIHHSVADGRGSMQIMSTLDTIYTAMMEQKPLPLLKNYRKIPYRLLKEPFFKILVRTFTAKEDPLAARNDMDLVDCTNESPKEENFVSLKIPKETIVRLKEEYKDWNYSTNDIIVYQLLQIASSLIGEQERSDGQKPVVNVGIAVDSRKNIKKDILTITNYASMCPFYLETDTLSDKGKVKAALQEFKATAEGLSFSKEFMLMALFPYAIQKKVFDGNVKNMIKEMSCKGIQTTNVGEMTRFVGSYHNSLKYTEFIGPAGRYGMPILSISLYEGDVSIFFRRTNDSNGICERLRDLLNEKLNEFQ